MQVPSPSRSHAGPMGSVTSSSPTTGGYVIAPVGLGDPETCPTLGRPALPIVGALGRRQPLVVGAVPRTPLAGDWPAGTAADTAAPQPVGVAERSPALRAGGGR